VQLGPLRSIAAASAAATVLLAAAPAYAVTVPNGPASSAEAYSLLVDVKLLAGNVPVRQGPISHAAQEFPVGAAQPSTAQVLSLGPVPADGSVVGHVGVMTSVAGANGAPNAVSLSQVNDLSLLGAGSAAKITARTVTAQANADCSTAPNGAGTVFEDLVVNGTPINYTPAPNTVIDLVVAKVILNEQRPAFDGRGIVVNAIHVISTTAGDPLFRGDVVVSHAMSTVSCPNGAGTTGQATVLKMTKSASPSTVAPGGEVTYSAHVTNASTSPCLVTQFIEHLNGAFDFVSTTGDFGTALDRTVQRPGGGADLVLGNGKTIPVGGTFNQTFVVKAKDAAAPGVYFNNLEIFCANLGDFVKGLDAPVRITGGTPDQPGPGRKPQCSDGKDNDGDGKIDFGTDPGCASPQDDDERDAPATLPRTGGSDGLTLFAGFGLLGLAVVTRRLRAVL
jgi:uncharacterized repeat protein (TIGR01451 family)